jgi:hypothetical protein
MKNQMFLTLLFIAALLDACSKSDPSPIAADCSAITKKFGDAAVLFATSPNTANCRAYLAAANEYLDKAGACGVSAADIADARQGIAATTCP